jgi:hypothetical protein
VTVQARLLRRHSFQLVLHFSAAGVTFFPKSDRRRYRKVIAKALLKGISIQSVYYIKKVSNVLHGRIEDRDLTTKRVPLYYAIDKATLFHGLDRKYQKLLFILSDGLPTDHGNVYSIQSKFQQENVTDVSCFISKSSRVEPRLFQPRPLQEQYSSKTSEG